MRTRTTLEGRIQEREKAGIKKAKWPDTDDHIRAELNRLARGVRKIDLKKYGFPDEMEAVQAIQKTVLGLIREAKR